MEITNVDVPPAIMDNIADKVTEKVKETIPPLRIYATLFVDDKGLEVNAINPLFILVKQKEHLERNVDNIDMKHLSPRELGQIVSSLHQR